MATTTMVHVRVDEAVKIQAAATLATMGLSVSDAVRMLLVRVVTERALPFDVRVPNAETVAAIRELEAGHGQRFERRGEPVGRCWTKSSALVTSSYEPCIRVGVHCRVGEKCNDPI